MRILFTGGGSGGHVFPIIAIIRALKTIAEEEHIAELELFYIGPDYLGADAFFEENVSIIPITSGKFRRYFSLTNIIDFFKVPIGFLQALWNIFLIMPDIVFSKGGFGALPAVLAAIIFRIPLIIHESDAVPGKVNRFSARFARRIGIAFAGAEEHFPKEKTARVGVPIRKRILGGKRELSKERFDIFSTLPVVVIMGASLGSQRINNAVLGVLKELTEEYEILHQTGKNNFEDVKGESNIILEFGHKERYHPFGFLGEQDVRDFYQAANLIVSRAGASSIFEIASWGKPSILIPLRHAAQDHQRKNAYEYAATGGAAIIEEGNLSPHILLGEIDKLMRDPEKLKKMGESAQSFARMDSAELISREILKLGIH